MSQFDASKDAIFRVGNAGSMFVYVTGDSTRRQQIKKRIGGQPQEHLNESCVDCAGEFFLCTSCSRVEQLPETIRAAPVHTLEGPRQFLPFIGSSRSKGYELADEMGVAAVA